MPQPPSPSRSKAVYLIVAVEVCLTSRNLSALPPEPSDNRAALRSQHQIEQPATVDSGESTNTDMFCGPRRAQMLLGYYGKNEEMQSLIKEIQDEDWKNGSNMSSIEEALRKRGVHTAALETGAWARLSWPHPIIMHIPSREQGVGHFIVQLPSPRFSNWQFACVWLVLGRTEQISHWRLGSVRSPVVLLTSGAPIREPESAVLPVVPFTSWAIAVTAAFILLTSARRLVAYARKRRCHAE